MEVPHSGALKSCARCSTTFGRFIRVAELDTYLCDRCYQRYRKELTMELHKIPPFGEVRYDTAGNPICHICGYAYRKVLSHVWQVHGISADEYKRRYGLFTTKSVCCEGTKELLRTAVAEHFDLVVANNLTNRGRETRFRPGGPGRTRAQMSEQCRRQLVARNKGQSPKVWAVRKEGPWLPGKANLDGTKKP